MPRADGDDPAIAAAFLHRFRTDQAAGDVGDLAAYQAAFRGHEDLIEREYRALTVGRAGHGGDEDGTPGPRIAHYRLLEELGRGGQGVVHKARDTRLKRLVALKVIGPALESTEVLRRFRREAEVASRLDHPGICGILDSGRSDGQTYIAMRYVEGRSLAQELARSELPTSREAIVRVARLVENAARAADTAHRAGIIHRDIKPGNIMVTPAGDPVLLDFGLARDESEDVARLTQTGDVFGTPAYMSPEQLRGESAPVDRRTDVYALGAVLFECLTLRPPFAAPGREALFRAVLEQPAPSPQTLNRAVPHDLAVVVMTALEKERERRYATAEDFADDLARVCRFEPIRARPVSPAVRAWRWVQRNRTVAAFMTLLIIVLTVALSIVTSNNQELAAALEDARAGRLSKKQQQVQELIERGFQALFSADSAAAAPIFDEALELDPGNKTAIAGRYWHDIYEPEKALAVLDRNGAAPGEDPDLLWMRGLVLDMAGRKDQAAACFERAGETDTHLRAYLKGLQATRSFHSDDSGDLKRAMSFFRQAILKAPSPQFHYFHSLAMAAAGAQDHKTLIEAVAMLEHHWPDSPATLEAVAQFLLPVDRPRAVRALERLMQTRPSATACTGLAVVALQDGDEEAAMHWYDRGVALDPDFAPIRLMRGQLCEKQGLLDEAIADYEAAMEQQPRLDLDAKIRQLREQKKSR